MFSALALTRIFLRCFKFLYVSSRKAIQPVGKTKVLSKMWADVVVAAVLMSIRVYVLA